MKLFAFYSWGSDIDISCAWERKGKHVHVEDTDGTKGTRIPLGHVALHGWLHRVCKLADDRDSPCRTWEVTFLIPINRLLEDEQRSDDSDGCVEPCYCPRGRRKDGGDGDVVERLGCGGGHMSLG